MKKLYLPKAKNSCGFVILGSKTAFFAMFLFAALAFFFAALIIKNKTKNKGDIL